LDVQKELGATISVTNECFNDEDGGEGVLYFFVAGPAPPAAGGTAGVALPPPDTAPAADLLSAVLGVGLFGSSNESAYNR
jgi:hypothetical protein